MLRRFCRVTTPFRGRCRLISTSFDCNQTQTFLCDPPPTKVTVEKDDYINYYTDMLRIRRMENEAGAMYLRQEVRGFCHLYIGQESVCTGIEAALRKEDHIITAYRCHGQQLLRGDSMESIFSELTGKMTGSAKGKGGSMHMYLPQNNFYGGNGIVGAQVPVGAGLAFASKYFNDGTVVAALYGDGAANQGQIFEAANMASLWKLPLMFVCENNEFGMGTPIHRAAAETNFYKRGSYIAGIQCDGMNVLAVRETMEYAAEWCRSGKGPIFVEVKTYRYGGHSLSDPGVGAYRDKEEIDAVKKNKDAINNVEKNLTELGWITTDEIKEIKSAVKKEVKAAVAFAKEQSELPPDRLYDDVYKGGKVGFIRATDVEKSVEIL
uniref:Pyruvate dehydrogenase E1 component subunit alpha n=1 Tax=Hirondellea gigas TaxID=1518452 RepID=A0A6A7G9J5_9CRUS